MQPDPETPWIGVIIASSSRAKLLGETLTELSKQTVAPRFVVLSVHETSDLPDLNDLVLPAGCELHSVLGEKGSTVQRNRGVERLARLIDFRFVPGIVVFLDDDFVARGDWLASLISRISESPRIVGLTGILLADGAPGAGYNTHEAIQILHDGVSKLDASDWRMLEGPVTSLYGCNMAIRSEIMAELRFDEGLPLYAWLEDYDFSVRLGEYGDLYRSAKLVGVHLGTKAGRSSGVRIGYSQIVNPQHLRRKGTMSTRTALKYASKNFVANVIGSIIGDRHIDRPGRLRGNCRAILDIVSRRASPGRISSLS